MESFIQPAHPPVFLQTPPSAPPLHPDMADNINHHSIGEASSSTAPPPPPPHIPPPSGKASHESVIVHEPSPSAPPLADEDIETVEEGPVYYPTIDSTPVDVPSPSHLPASIDGERKMTEALDSVRYVLTLHLKLFVSRVDMSRDACLA